MPRLVGLGLPDDVLLEFFFSLSGLAVVFSHSAPEASLNRENFHRAGSRRSYNKTSSEEVFRLFLFWLQEVVQNLVEGWAEGDSFCWWGEAISVGLNRNTHTCHNWAWF